MNSPKNKKKGISRIATIFIKKNILWKRNIRIEFISQFISTWWAQIDCNRPELLNNFLLFEFIYVIGISLLGIIYIPCIVRLAVRLTSPLADIERPRFFIHTVR